MESFVFWFISNVQCPGGSKGNIKCTKTQEIRQDMKEFLNSAKNTRNFIFYYHHIIGWKKNLEKLFYAIHGQTYFFDRLPHHVFLLTKTNRNANKKAPLEINVQFTPALNTMEFWILNTSRKTRSALVMMVNVSISDHYGAWNGLVITVTTNTSQWLSLVNLFTYQPLAVKYVVVVACLIDCLI